jgi:hypothetical protein
VRVRHPGSESLAAADQIRGPLLLMRGDSVPHRSENLPSVLDILGLCTVGVMRVVPRLPIMTSKKNHIALSNVINMSLSDG